MCLLLCMCVCECVLHTYNYVRTLHVHMYTYTYTALHVCVFVELKEEKNIMIGLLVRYTVMVEHEARVYRIFYYIIESQSLHVLSMIYLTPMK